MINQYKLNISVTVPYHAHSRKRTNQLIEKQIKQRIAEVLEDCSFIDLYVGQDVPGLPDECTKELKFKIKNVS